MDAFVRALNAMLTTTYRSICKVEELMLRKLSDDRLSLSEMHMLESIGMCCDGCATVTEIAQNLKITPPSATATIKRLEKKGYIRKDRSSEDARRVRVQLTEEGFRAEIAHRYFHRKMVRAIAENMTAEEQAAMYSGLQKMNAYIRRQLEDCAAGKEVKP